MLVFLKKDPKEAKHNLAGRVKYVLKIWYKIYVLHFVFFNFMEYEGYWTMLSWNQTDNKLFVLIMPHLHLIQHMMNKMWLYFQQWG